jgi:hypothetical protein
MIKKEYVIVIIIGLFLLSYVLDALVDPLAIKLANPFEYLNPNYLSTYPFTTASVVIRAIALFLTPLLILSAFEGHATAKGAVLLVLIPLMLLFALQDVVTSAQVVPLEWALSITLAAVALLVPMVWYFLQGAVHSVHRTLGGAPEEPPEELSVESEPEGSSKDKEEATN